MVTPTVELPEHERERERALSRLGWSPFFQEFIPHTEGTGDEVARVIAPHRSAFEVLSATGELLASLTGRLLLAIEQGEEERPAVGDWVVIDARPSEGTATVHAVLPRRTKLSRKAAGRTAAEQVLAANVDVAFLVSALTRDLNIRRLERYLALVREGRDSHEVTGSGEHRPAQPTGGEAEVGRDDTRVDAAHRSDRPPLLLTERSGKGKDLLPPRDRR